MKKILITISTSYIFIFIVLPLFSLLLSGFSKGPEKWLEGVLHSDTIQAFLLSLSLIVVSLPFNAIFGLAAAWLICHFDFPGKKVLRATLDLPLTISPVVAGLMLILAYGKNSPIGGFFDQLGFAIIFSWPGLFLATLFVTFPYVAKEILPIMEEQGHNEEEAGLLLGANGWKVFFLITLPKIKWGLFYGLILAAARAAGEYGAASVVSGLLRGKTVTLPIQVQIYFSEYQTIRSYGAATFFFAFAIISLVVKKVVQKKRGE
ncbi:sulfate ABC transporter permease [Spirochaeta cellobiosiphila]|uniref:sulfate ABC transporter permease n=1 Tax=Spirochaeta cellobiosiphila TaxID=504483 RepID=UPI00040FC57B|nr:sulfate ABC transporter permease subunit [Spirochaeta cellobiosiphila]